jgi:hypothetical protein
MFADPSAARCRHAFWFSGKDFGQAAERGGLNSVTIKLGFVTRRVQCVTARRGARPGRSHRSRGHQLARSICDGSLRQAHPAIVTLRTAIPGLRALSLCGRLICEHERSVWRPRRGALDEYPLSAWFRDATHERGIAFSRRPANA